MTDVKKVASFEDLINATGTKYQTLDVFGTTLRFGTLSTKDMMIWLEENADPEKSKLAGFRILVKAVVDADGKRIPEDKHEEFINIFRAKDNEDNSKAIAFVLEMNGLRKKADVSEAVKND